MKNLKDLLIELLLIIFIFSNVLKQYFSIFQYTDEILAIFMIVYLILYTIKKPISLIMFKTIIISIIIILIGLIGTKISHIQKNNAAILIDILAIFKFIPIFWGAVLLNKSSKQNSKIWNFVSKIIRIFVFIGAICSVLNIFMDINMHTDIRYGVRSFNFVYSRVGGLYNACVVFLVIQLMDIQYNGNTKRKELFLWITCILMASTLRTRAFVFAILFILGYNIFTKKKKIKLNVFKIILIILITFFISYNQIRYYFVDNETQARNILLKYSIVTAKEYFPFGAGFATYGTNSAKLYWSSLYNKYHFERYYGLGRVKTTYLTDTYWPAILGEFGIFGLILMIILLYFIIKFSLQNTKSNNIQYFSIIYLYITILISSTVTSSLITSSLQIFVIGMIISNSINQSKIKIMKER